MLSLASRLKNFATGRGAQTELAGLFIKQGELDYVFA
jgi:hypothetical protein